MQMFYVKSDSTPANIGWLHPGVAMSGSVARSALVSFNTLQINQGIEVQEL